MAFLKNRKIQLLGIIILFSTLSSLVVFSTDRIFDYDSLYHIRHAWLYRTEGLSFSDFPWLQFSSIGELKSDIWYGFHLFLLPFTFFPDFIFSIRLSSVVLAVFFLLSFYLILKRLPVKYPLFFTVLLYFSSGDFLFRINMCRPHIFSFIFSLFLLFSLSSGLFWWSFLFSFFLAFFHVSLFWLSFLVFSVVFIFKLWLSKKIFLSDFFSVFLGSVAGLFLRPNPLGSLKLAYIQIFDLILAKRAGIPLKFGRELLPLSSSDIIFQFLPLAAIFFFSIFLFINLARNEKFFSLAVEEKIFLFSSSFLSFVFLLLSFFVARRSADFLSIFLLLSFSILFSLWLKDVFKKTKNKRFKIIIFSASLIFLLISAARSIYVVSLFEKNSDSPDKFKEISLWLKDNTKPGEIVYNSYWDNFPNLFFWNWQNYYRGGMDPIFQYSFSQDLFWKNYFIAYRGAPYTCGKIRCTESEVEDASLVLKRDFHASYIILEYRRSPNFIKVADSSPNFEKVFSTPTEVVYKIL